MTSTHAPLIDLAQDVIQNDITKAAPLLQLLGKFGSARGDPMEEADRRDVMLWLYSKTEHCEDSMRQFISEVEVDQSRLVA